MGISTIRSKLKRGLALTQKESGDLWEYIRSLEKQQLKTGHWIDNMDLGYHVSICSNCDWRGHGDTCLIYKPKYCPNCGARMIEPWESEEV